jgi:hypothetical protein
MVQQNQREEKMKKSVVVFFSVFLAMSFFACTFKHAIPIRYTPIVQMERLPDKDHPTVIVVGEFTDDRKEKTLFSKHLNPISVHKVKGETTGDLALILRDAFVDGFLKSGFEVPMGAPSTTPLLTLTGRITTYNVAIKSKWKTVTMTAFVDLEVTMKRDDGQELVVACSGTSLLDSKGSISYDSAGTALDQATQDCVKKFFADQKFRSFLTKQS